MGFDFKPKQHLIHNTEGRCIRDFDHGAIDN